MISVVWHRSTTVNTVPVLFGSHSFICIYMIISSSSRIYNSIHIISMIFTRIINTITTTTWITITITTISIVTTTVSMVTMTVIITSEVLLTTNSTMAKMPPPPWVVLTVSCRQCPPWVLWSNGPYLLFRTKSWKLWKSHADDFAVTSHSRHSFAPVSWSLSADSVLLLLGRFGGKCVFFLEEWINYQHVTELWVTGVWLSNQHVQMKHNFFFWGGWGVNSHSLAGPDWSYMSEGERCSDKSLPYLSGCSFISPSDTFISWISTSHQPQNTSGQSFLSLGNMLILIYWSLTSHQPQNQQTPF